MAVSLEKNSTDTSTGLHNQQELISFLNAVATAENSYYLAHDLPKKFAHLITFSTQKILNDINAQILKTDDLDLISLFKRAVRNHNSLVEDKDKADPVTSFYTHHTPPSFLIPTIHLTLDVQETHVVVTTQLSVEHNGNSTSLILDGQDHQILEVSINGECLAKESYKATKNELILYNIPRNKHFDVVVKSVINPFKNTSLQGLYSCGQILTTQCESEGARRIFFTLDRPDVLSKITTTIIADETKYPYRLSNGNPIHQNTKQGQSSTITWEDPIPKPSYLFACVLGEFDKLSDTFTTKSGKKVDLEVYVEPGKKSRAAYSLIALKKAMEFDEKEFDREYDLSCLKMVGIPNFIAGAMENKGLMIFNDTRLLVDASTGTDADFRTVDQIVSHEYFHNWSGNRVTVRDWFQLALKEAFTDLRSMLFGIWRFGEEYIRPKNILALWEHQFPEDLSPQAHPIVVDSYVDSDSIYDSTTYIKGREIFRTLQIFLNQKVPDGFRKTQNLYFEKYDGQAVTFKELLECAEEILQTNNESLGHFERWFHQIGTPTVKVSMDYEPNRYDAKFTVTQSCINPKTGESQPPLPIPFSLELLDIHGEVIGMQADFLLEAETHELPLYYVMKRPIPIIMHGYGAPVKIEYDYTMPELACIMRHCTDTFNRWHAGRQYAMLALKETLEKLKKYPKLKDQSEVVIKDLIQVYANILKDEKLSPLAKAQFLQIPTIRSMSQNFNCYDFKQLKETRSFFIKQLALLCKPQLQDLLQKHPEPMSKTPNAPTSEEMQIRELRNTCWGLLARIDDASLEKTYSNYVYDLNFNNTLAAFNILIDSNSDLKEIVSQHFYDRWNNDKAVFNNWLTANASSATCTVEHLRKLEQVQGYDPTNANHVRSIFRSFCNNLGCYHDEQGEGYKYIADKILGIYKFNPSLAANDIATNAFVDFEKLPKHQQILMASELRRLEPQVSGQLKDLIKQLLSCSNY